MYSEWPEEALDDNFDEIRGRSWIVADRHAGAEKGWELVLLIPLASAIQKLSEEGKIVPKTEDISKALPAIIEEMFTRARSAK